MPVLRSLLHLAGSALVFSVGWTASGARQHPAPPPAVVAPPTEPAACADPLAMAANATLVGEVRDARRDLALANERIQASVPASELLPGRLQASPEDWARRATDDSVTLRLPCARWDGAPSFTVHGPRRLTHVRRPGDAGRRADFLGLAPEEREMLAQLYGRMPSRVWSSMKQVCESDREYRAAVAEDRDLDDAGRVAACRDALVVASDPATRRAYHEVVSLRAGGHKGDHLDARGRVIFALTGAPEALFDEMKRTFGNESALRLIDHGVSCFDETAYDLRSGEPGG